MKEIKITEKNKRLYENLYSIKKGKSFPSKKANIMSVLVTVILMIATLNIQSMIFRQFELTYITEILSFTGTILNCMVLPVILLQKISILFNVKEFKKQHLGIDTSLSTSEIAKQLEKYKETQKHFFEVKKGTMPLKKSDNSKTHTKTVQQKLADLEKEKEFWQQIQQTNEKKELQKK